MKYKQETLGDIINSEKKMILQGAEDYGTYFINACEFNYLLQEFLKSVDPDRFIFATFLSQIRKHHTLAIFSAVRLHHTQAMMCLRQVLEAGAFAAYAIANPEQSSFADIDKNGIIEATDKQAMKRYKWLEENFKNGSDAIKRIKGLINKTAAHSNIVYAQKNFKFDKKTGKFSTPFFDVEDDYSIKTDLWQIANIAIGILDLFYGVNKELNVIIFADDFIPRLKKLENKNIRLKNEIINTDRFKNAQKLQTYDKKI